jgi:outer membrane PBP1 activator LpoA protein
MLSSIIHYGQRDRATMKKMTLKHCFALLCIIGLTSCSTPHVFENTFSSHPQSVSRDNIPLTLENPDFWQGSPDTVWSRVQQTPLDKLSANENNPDTVKAGWIKLAIISKRYSVDTTTLTQQLIAWRAQYPSHPGNEIFPNDAALNSLAATPAPKNIALLLPLQGKYAALGNAVRNGFLNAYYEQSGKSAGQNISFIDTSTGASIGALYQQAIAKGADFVVGPLTKDEVQQLISAGGFNVPTLALNYTGVWLSLTIFMNLVCHR